MRRLNMRSFSAPALDALWWAMEDLQPLFSLLEGFRIEGQGAAETFAICGPILEGECNIFVKYAMRIRFYSMTTESNIHTSAYVKVLRATSRSCLLPCLNYLQCTIGSPLLLFLISPLLRLFCAESPSLEPCDIHTFIDELGPVAQNLKCLRLKLPLTNSILQAVIQAPSLEYLSLHSENDHSLSVTRFFEDLSSSATLKFLRLAGAMHIDNGPSTVPMLSFPNLWDFKLEPKELLAVKNVTSFFRYAKLPWLAKFKCHIALIATNETLKPDDLSDFLNTLGQATNFSLHELDFGRYQKAYKSKVGPTIADLPILARFQLLDLRIPFLNPVSPGDIKFMINSWPDLRHLELGSLQHPKLGFEEIVRIANGLPRLRSLRMEFIFRGLPSINEVPVLRHKMGVLILRLFLAESSIDDPARLDDPMVFARCIDRLFPKLELPNCGFLVPNGFDTSPWTRIGLILLQLQGARNDQALRVDGTSKSDTESDVSMS
ncbi:hypothetical protein GALMADRAFT_281640 [Galerina marginata CBS 339.88]|uniref:F-box domain-containing protein n=1 Tax=Galerina marginata (strain CBS 339.88) TaxID=685588 RepID=A0A067SVQ3_GALM3|nr:hypothetical protein GALMADRAFT_281640 [Galerina marginata CBS 339.88]